MIQRTSFKRGNIDPLLVDGNWGPMLTWVNRNENGGRREAGPRGGGWRHHATPLATLLVTS